MKTHLVGVGGIGMSGIAQLLLANGDRVSGSDTAESSLLTQMRAGGATIWKGHAASHVDGADRVVYSSSITPQNPELKAARNRQVPVRHRAQMVSQLVGSRRMVAVTGSHGKSTATALSAQLLVAAGLDPMAIIGAEVEALGGNVRSGRPVALPRSRHFRRPPAGWRVPGLGRGYAVVEADESDGSFLWFRPYAAIITNIDEEHLDYFRNFGEIIEAYAAFANRVEPGGLVIGCLDDPWVRRLLAANSRLQISYGLSREAQISASDIEIGPGWSRFRCLRFGKTLGTIHLQIPGSHNLLNSLGVIALSQGLGIDFKVTRQALEDYHGAKRRFQVRGEVNGVMVVEDYAHHPAEIQSTLQAARGWKGRRIRCVFQPHRYSRTRYLLDRFGASFALADEVTLLPIYAASEEPLDGINSEAVLRAVQAGGKPDARLESPEKLLERLTADAREGDIVLFLGAGSVGALAPRLVEMLQAIGRPETAGFSGTLAGPGEAGCAHIEPSLSPPESSSPAENRARSGSQWPSKPTASARPQPSRKLKPSIRKGPAYASELMAATGGRVRFAEPMRLHTTFHLGGPAEIWVEPRDSEELRAVLKIARDAALPITVIGGGANLLVRDEGISGLVVHLGSQKFQECRRTPEGLAAGAGLPLDRLIRRAGQESLAGVEFLAGVPGRVGGATRMNAGTHDDEGTIHNFSDVVAAITVMDFSGGTRVLSPDQIGFAYRSSRLPDQIVVEVDLVLHPDDPQAIAGRVKRLWEFKKKTQDWSAPSAGCIFKNPAGPHAAGWLIDHAGLKGFQIGGAAISARHANFMVNVSNAKASDVFALISEVRQRVQKQFGVALELEVQVLPPLRHSDPEPKANGKNLVFPPKVDSPLAKKARSFAPLRMTTDKLGIPQFDRLTMTADHSAFKGPIGVLCGGPSGEREISLRSGAAVQEALAAQGLPAVLLALSEKREQIPDQVRRAKLSCAFVVLHGPFGEDGAIQAILDEMRIPYTGSAVESSHRAMDKIVSRQVWAAAQLPIPRWVEVPPVTLSLSKGDRNLLMLRQAQHERIGFPLIVKPAAQGSSLGISLVDDAQQLPAAVEEAARYGDPVLLEEYLAGPEITVGILQDRPLPVVQVKPKRRFYDYIAKYTPGMTEYLVPAPLPEETARTAQELALKAHQALGCRSFSRVDMILSPDRGPVLLEINTIPGMTGSSLLPKAAAAAGISFQELCRRMLLSAVE